MRVPFSWLKEYVDVRGLTAQEVAERLTAVGLEVAMIEKAGGDSIFDIEITPNRPDCLSISGVAREAAAALGRKLKIPRAVLDRPEIKEVPAIEIRDKKLCPRYTARIIRNVTVGPSPKWLVEKLEKMGLRSVNNAVDITNFCLFEQGQPTHVFDYDKLKGRITVRRAGPRERIVTIDGKERELSAETLVIADEEKAAAVAGVMGSRDTEVTDATKNILLESACFNPVSVRRTSRRLGLISESSYRFERSVDIGNVISTSDRASFMLRNLCGGEAGALKAVGIKDPKPLKISLRPERLNKILGIKIRLSVIKRILKTLGLKAVSPEKKEIIATVPTFRQDLKSEIDLVEEVIRIYGYDKLPSTLPAMTGHSVRVAPERTFSNLAKDTLISLGAYEVINYSMVSKDDLAPFGGVSSKRCVFIKNPLSIEQEVMRTTLLPGLLRTVSWNLNRGTKRLRLFEVGNAYFRDRDAYIEEGMIAIVFAGVHPGRRPSRREDLFFDLKGAIEILFKKLGVEGAEFCGEGLPGFLEDTGAGIEISGERIGFIGKLKNEAADKFDIKTELFLCEASLEGLFSHADLKKRFRPLPRFPSAKRDISLVVKKGVTHREIVSVMNRAGGELIANIELFDQYFGAQIPKGSRGLSYSIEYRAQDRTLTYEEVSRLHTLLCTALRESLGAEIR